MSNSAENQSKSTALQIPAGLELLFEAEKANLLSPTHTFVLSIHWAIVRAGLRFNSSNEGQKYTERLPEGWPLLVDQISQGKLTFNYVDPITGDTFEVKYVEVSPNDTVVVTVFHKKATGSQAQTPMSTGTDKQQTSSATTFEIAAFVNKNSADQTPSSATVYTTANELERKVWTDLFEPIGLHVLGQAPVLGPYDDKTKKEEKKSETGGRDMSNDYEESYYPGIGGIGARPSPLRPGPLQPGGIGGPLIDLPPLGGGGLGRSDLDPLGRIGAGMLADPRGFRNPRTLPPAGVGPGQLPPGARFDPFGPIPPPGTGGTGARPANFGQPNPDHERPPDFDDMFM